MSSRPKPWYSERDCPVCTRSASSFCRNPLYSFAHAMWVKWWYHAKIQHFQSSFCSDFQFHGHFVNDWKIANIIFFLFCFIFSSIYFWVVFSFLLYLFSSIYFWVVFLYSFFIFSYSFSFFSAIFSVSARSFQIWIV